MPRRKSQIDPDVVASVGELRENQQIVIEETKTVRKENAPAAANDDDDDDKGYIDVDDDGEEIERGDFSQTSIAALLFDEDNQPIENQYCTIHVRRKPDKMKDNFLTPCTSSLSYPALANIEITAEQSEIEETVRQQYGGGHYFFQIRFQNRLGRSWETSLADLPEQIAAAKAKDAPQTAPTPAPAINPLDQFFDNLEKQQRMKNLLFGDEQKRLEAEIERLRTELASKPQSQTNQSDLALLLAAMKESNSPGIIDFAREYLSGENAEQKFGMWDFAKTVWENKSELAPLAGSLFGGMMPTPQKNIADLMRAQPPSPAAVGEPAALPSDPPPQIPASNFRRRPRAGEGGDADARSGTGVYVDDEGDLVDPDNRTIFPKQDELDRDDVKEKTDDASSGD